MATGSSTLVEVGSDGGLVLGTLAGDHSTFAALYDRFAARIHDFHLALLRDPYQAAEATYRTFRQAVTELNHLGEPTGLRSWLYTMAYRQASRRRKPGSQPGYGGAFNWPPGARPSHDSQMPMWRALPAKLSQRDRALLTLHLRHGIDRSEAGAIIGLSGRRARARLEKLRPRLEPALQPLLTGRLGAGHAAGGAFSGVNAFRGPSDNGTPPSGAPVDERTTDDNPSPLRMAVPFTTPPPELRSELLRQTPLISAHEGLPRPRTRGAWITTVVTVIVVIVGSVLFIHRSMERRPVIAVRFGPSSELALSSTVVDLGAANSTAVITLSNTGSHQLAWHANPADPWLKVNPATGTLAGGQSQQLTVTADRSALPEGDGRTQLKVSSSDDQSQGAIAIALREERPPAILNPRASNTRIGGYGCPTTSEISATVRDESAPIRVMLVSPGRPNQPMQARGGVYVGKLGSGSGSNIAWRIMATDARNNIATSPTSVITHGDCAARPAPKPVAPPKPTQQPSTPEPGTPEPSPTPSPSDGSSEGNPSSPSGGDSGSSSGSSGDNGGSNSGDGSGDSPGSGGGSSGGDNTPSGGGFDPSGG